MSSSARSARSRLVAGALIAILGLAAHDAQAQPNAPTFSKNYFVTGDYVVYGVGLKGTGVNGFATKLIKVPAAAFPQNAEPVAAFLYWATVVTKTDKAAGVIGAQFNDKDIAAVTKIINPSGTSPCWSSGGGTGSPDGSHQMMLHRADVLRYLGKDQYGRPIAGGDFKVKLPDSGSSGNQVPFTLGASLVIIYRTPESAAAPLRSIVLYEGGFIVDQQHDVLGPTTLEGFYEASKTTPSAKLSVIVGNASSGFSEQLIFNGALLATNPFQGTAGSPEGTPTPVTDTGWDNRTFDVSGKVPGDASSVTVGITHSTPTFDCLSGGTYIFSTTVQDKDGDGLIDRIEDSPTTLKSPRGDDLPNLYNMNGGRIGSDQKDLYIEIGALVADANNPYGAHSHLPSPAAVKMFGDAFRDAPDLHGIRVHFDLGPTYTAGAAAEYVITGSQGAKGGRTIKEVTCDSTLPKIKCRFPGYAGVVSWKSGFQAYRDAPVDADGKELDGPGETACVGVKPGTQVTYTQGTTAVTVTCGGSRFDDDRKDIFRYVLFAHWRGLPKSPMPCIDPNTHAPTTQGYANGACTAPYADNLDFHVPTSSSGVADMPGGDALITLGGWTNIQKIDYVHAATLMHELGHTFWRTHGGELTLPRQQANCKVNYFSVMSYLYQLRGLLDDAGAPHPDYAGAIFDQVDERSLSDSTTMPSLSYRAAWFAPAGPDTTAAALGLVPAKGYCDGTAFADPTHAPMMVRVDNTSVSAPIDWALDGTGATVPQDVNFDGIAETGSTALTGSNDWASLQLRQLGARRNMAGFSLGINLAGAGIDFGGGAGIDFGGGAGIDFGGGAGIDFGGGAGIDFGGGAGIDFGGGASCGNGIDCGGGIDSGSGAGIDFGGGVELDADIANRLGNTPPNQLKACVIGTSADCTGTQVHRVKVTWEAPNVGNVTTYKVYRIFAGAVTKANATDKALVASVSGSTSPLSVVDTVELPDGHLLSAKDFTYYVLAVFDSGVVSPSSNFARITPTNEAPFAANNSYSYSLVKNTTLTKKVADDNDSAQAGLKAVQTTAPANGTVTFNADGTFTYAPNKNYTGPDKFSYSANDGTFSYTAADGGVRNTGATMSASSTITVFVTVTNK